MRATVRSGSRGRDERRCGRLERVASTPTNTSRPRSAPLHSVSMSSWVLVALGSWWCGVVRWAACVPWWDDGAPAHQPPPSVERSSGCTHITPHQHSNHTPTPHTHTHTSISGQAHKQGGCMCASASRSARPPSVSPLVRPPLLCLRFVCSSPLLLSSLLFRLPLVVCRLLCLPYLSSLFHPSSTDGASERSTPPWIEQHLRGTTQQHKHTTHVHRGQSSLPLLLTSLSVRVLSERRGAVGRVGRSACWCEGGVVSAPSRCIAGTLIHGHNHSRSNQHNHIHTHTDEHNTSQQHHYSISICGGTPRDRRRRQKIWFFAGRRRMQELRRP